ncbi:MAG: high-potential iron-sulfur protein [Nevskia sp.]|nr:high-potential iron-sulfur protein [Nevskia sp.]
MSSKPSFNLSRRQLLTYLAIGGVAAPLCSIGPALAADLPHVAADDPTAKALGYVEDATKINAKTEALYKAASHCANCQLFQAAQAKGGYAPCAVFPGKVVNQNGWCRSWTAKA